MIGYLKGRVLESLPDGRMVIGVGADESVIGYAVATPPGPAYLDFVPGRVVEVFVHTHVREDALDLYGFATRQEKELFLTLLSVNGIGPKGAMGILSKISPDTLVQAILDGDRESLTRVPGIGKKTAERVVLELADPLRKRVESGAWQGLAAVAAGKPMVATGTAPARSGRGALLREARDALGGLGYREHEILPLLEKLLAEPAAPVRVEDVIRTALKRLSSPELERRS